MWGLLNTHTHKRQKNNKYKEVFSIKHHRDKEVNYFFFFFLNLKQFYEPINITPSLEHEVFTLATTRKTSKKIVRKRRRRWGGGEEEERKRTRNLFLEDGERARKKNTKLVRSSLRLLPLPPDTDGEKVSGSFSWLVSIVMRIQDKWRGTDEEETMRGRKELIEGEKKQIQQRGVAVEEVKGGRRRAQREGNIGGTSSSDMDPQDLPLETATFRGTWESHRWKGRALALFFFFLNTFFFNMHQTPQNNSKQTTICSFLSKHGNPCPTSQTFIKFKKNGQIFIF